MFRALPRLLLAHTTAGAKRPLPGKPAAAPADSPTSPVKPPRGGHLFIRAGLPLTIFTIGAMFVLRDGLEGKNKERDASKGMASKSERQARMEREKDDMMEKITKKMGEEFDNTRRIERPEEILERRRRERELQETHGIEGRGGGLLGSSRRSHIEE